MQAEARRRHVLVNEAGLGRRLVVSNLPPEVEDHRRDWRPRLAGNRVGSLVAVAAVAIGHPAERPEIGHAHRERLARARHGWRVERALGDRFTQRLEEVDLRRTIEIAGQEAKALDELIGAYHVANPEAARGERACITHRPPLPASGRIPWIEPTCGRFRPFL